MAINPKFIGKKYEPTTYKVCKEKIEEYATAVGDLNPLYLNEEVAKQSEFGKIIAPPTFAAIYMRKSAAKALFDPEIALNLSMLVHGEQEFEFFDVVKDDDIITTEGEVANIYEKKNLDFIEFLMTSKNQEGKVVCKGKFTFVIRR